MAKVQVLDHIASLVDHFKVFTSTFVLVEVQDSIGDKYRCDFVRQSQPTGNTS